MKFLKTIKIAPIPKNIVFILLISAAFFSLRFQPIPISGETSKTLFKMLFFPIVLLNFIISVMVDLLEFMPKSNQDNYQFN
jgi:hypothetical protein